MKFALPLLALAGLYHLPADTPTVPSPPAADPQQLIADCTQLGELWTQYQVLQEQVGRLTK